MTSLDDIGANRSRRVVAASVGDTPIAADERAVTARAASPVLLVGPMPPPRGGISIHIQRLSRLLSEQGVAFEQIDESRHKTEGIANLRRMSPYSYLAMMRRAALVHIHSSNRYVRLTHTCVARLLGARVLQTVHGHQDTYLSMLALRIACRMSHATIAVSDKVRAGIGLPARVLPAFVPPGPADEVVPRDVADWIADRRREGRRIIAMNAFRPMKTAGVDLYGLDMLVSAFDREDIRAGFAAIVCVANTEQDREYFEEIQQRIVSRGLGGVIELRTGQIEFAGVLSRCDLFVRPTTTDGDALSIREALWYAIPAIASDAAVRPEGTIVFPARDQSAFERCILRSSADAHGTASAGADYATEIFGIYRNLMSGRNVDQPGQ